MLSQAARELIQMQRSGSYGTERDVLKHRVYDSRFFAAAGVVTDNTFFVNQIGSPWRVGTKTLSETNMVDSGKLPAGQIFLVVRMSVRCITFAIPAGIVPSQLEQSFINVLDSSVFELKIQGREFDYQIHGSEFLPRPLAGAGTLAGAYSGAGMCVTTGWTKLDPTPVVIDNLVSFQVIQRLGNPDPAISGAGGVLGLSTIALNAANSVMQVTLEGVMTRAK